MSDTTKGTLYTAILNAQRAMGPVKKDATNPAFRTKYATLQSVLETVEVPLWDNGLLLLQRFDAGEGGPMLITEIVHAATGDRVASILPVVCKDPTDPQKIGGAITYARRYSLLALLGLSPEDDDGNSAAQPRPQPQPRPTPRQNTRTSEDEGFPYVKGAEGVGPSREAFARPTTPRQMPQDAPEAPAAPIPPEPLTDAQERTVAEARDMAEARDTLGAVDALLRSLKPATTPGQWKTISARRAKVVAEFYPESVLTGGK